MNTKATKFFTVRLFLSFTKPFHLYKISKREQSHSGIRGNKKVSFYYITKHPWDIKENFVILK